MTIREQLLEYRYGLLSDEEAAALEVRIKKEPEFAKAWAEIDQTLDIFAAATKVVPKKPIIWSDPNSTAFSTAFKTASVQGEDDEADPEGSGEHGQISGQYEKNDVSGETKVDPTAKAWSPLLGRFSQQYQGLNRFLVIGAVLLFFVSLTGLVFQQVGSSVTNEPLRVQVTGPSFLSTEDEQSLFVQVSDIQGNPKSAAVVELSFYDSNGKPLEGLDRTEKTEADGTLQLPIKPIQDQSEVRMRIAVGRNSLSQAEARLPVIDNFAMENSLAAQNFDVYGSSMAGNMPGNADAGSSRSQNPPVGFAQNSGQNSSLTRQTARNARGAQIQAQNRSNQSGSSTNNLLGQQGESPENTVAQKIPETLGLPKEPKEVENNHEMGASADTLAFDAHENRASQPAAAPPSFPVRPGARGASTGSAEQGAGGSGSEHRMAPLTVRAAPDRPVIPADNALPAQGAVPSRAATFESSEKDSLETNSAKIDIMDGTAGNEQPQIAQDAASSSQMRPQVQSQMQTPFQGGARRQSANRGVALQLEQQVVRSEQNNMQNIKTVIDSEKDGVPLAVVVNSRGSQLASRAIVANSGSNSVEIPVKENRPGAYNVKLYEIENSPPKLADSQWFYVRPNTFLNISEKTEIVPAEQGEKVRLKIRTTTETDQPAVSKVAVSAWVIEETPEESEHVRSFVSAQNNYGSNNISVEQFLDNAPSQAGNPLFANPSMNANTQFGEAFLRVAPSPRALANLDESLARHSSDSEAAITGFLNELSETENELIEEDFEDGLEMPPMVFDNYTQLRTGYRNALLERKTNPVLLGIALIGIIGGLAIGVAMGFLFMFRKISGPTTLVLGSVGVIASLLICIGLFKDSQPEEFAFETTKNVSFGSYIMEPTEDGKESGHSPTVQSLQQVPEAHHQGIEEPRVLEDDGPNSIFGYAGKPEEDAYGSFSESGLLYSEYDLETDENGNLSINFVRADPGKPCYIAIDAYANGNRIGSLRFLIPPRK